jgi:hypothetical protein
MNCRKAAVIWSVCCTQALEVKISYGDSMIFSVAFLMKQGRFIAITGILLAFKPYYFSYLLRRLDLEVRF